jgi:uncharacterized membrane protein
MWLLGPKHDTIYPTNVTSDQKIRLYLDVSNHLGVTASYAAEVKFRNAAQSAPNSFDQTYSTQPAIDRLSFSVADNAANELPIDVSFNYTINEEMRLLTMNTININGKTVDLHQTTIVYDVDRGGYFGNLFFELYLHNTQTDRYDYHQRYVSLWLQMLSTPSNAP